MKKPRGKIRSLEDLFSFCDVDGTTGCVNWKYSKSEFGHGRVRIGRRMEYTHRISFKMQNPDTDIQDLEVCHSCDNPSCVNPDHLFVGTHADNMKDMEMKGRAVKPGPINPKRHESHPNAKITSSDVENIRSLYKDGTKQVQIAKMFGISFQQISRIVNNLRWK